MLKIRYLLMKFIQSIWKVFEDKKHFCLILEIVINVRTKMKTCNITCNIAILKRLLCTRCTFVTFCGVTRCNVVCFKAFWLRTIGKYSGYDYFMLEFSGIRLFLGASYVILNIRPILVLWLLSMEAGPLH